MAYRTCCCSVTLLFPVCIRVFCTPLSLSVLWPFNLYAPYPFNAPFLDCVFLLPCSPSWYTPQFSYTATTPISSLFFILIVSIVFVHAIFAMPLHAHSTSNSSTTSSALSDHHRDSSDSLVVPTMCPTSLGVLLRFLNLSGS